MAEEQKQQPTGTESGGLWAVGYKVLGMSAEQQRGVVAIGLTIFLVWFVWDSVNEGRRAESERTALISRTIESEGEKNRQVVVENAKLTVGAVGDNTKMMIASHQKLASELGKLELRLGDLTAASRTLGQQVQELNNAITELRKKMPPGEVYHHAPMPRMKSGSLTVG